MKNFVFAACAATASMAAAEAPLLRELSVADVQDSLKAWSLDSAFADAFVSAQVDGHALSYLAEHVDELDTALYPDAQIFHFRKLADKVAELQVAENREVARPEARRKLGAAPHGFSGLSIETNNSAVTMGTEADVRLMRSGEEELTIGASTIVDGDLVVSGDFFLSDGDDARGYPFFPTLEENEGRVLDIRVRSRGYDDPCTQDEFIPNKPNTCGSWISVNGNLTSGSRGHTVVYYDDVTGKWAGSGGWDTYNDGDDSVSAADQMADFVADIPDGNIVMVLVHDSANNDVPYSRLAQMLTYGTDVHELYVGFRSSFCMIGRKGSDHSGGFLPWQQISSADQYDGPSDCSAVIQTGSYHAEVSGTYEITASSLTWNNMPITRNLWLRVLSVGYDDPEYGCVPVNGCSGPNLQSTMWVNGKEVEFKSSSIRGHSFTIINQFTGAVESTKTFDSHGDSTAGSSIESLVANITEGRIVMVMLHDSAGNYEHGDSLLSLMAGHEFDVDFSLRESFCMIGRKGKVSVSWMTYYFNERYNGPTWCEAIVPLMPADYQTAYDDYTGVDTEGYHDFSRRLEEEEEEQDGLADADTIDVE